MPFWTIIWGFLFFLNPNFEVLDLLPDFIGAALLLWGTRRLAGISEGGNALRRDLWRLLLLNILQTLSALLLPVIAKGEMTWMLLLTAVFGVAEAIFFIRVVSGLDKTLTFLAMQGNCDRVYAGDRLSGWSGMAVFFICLRTFLSVLPTLTYLVTDMGSVTVIETNWSFLFWLLQGANGLLTVIFGILFYLSTLRCFRPICRDTDFGSYLEERYRKEIIEAPGVLLYRRLREASRFFLLGLLFLLPLKLDGIDFLPDFAGGALLLAALGLLKPFYPKLVKPAVWLCGIWTGLAAAEWTANLLLLLKTGFLTGIDTQRLGYAAYLDQYLYHDSASYFAFLGICALSLLRAGCMAAALFLFYRVFRAIIADHTGGAVGLSTETAIRKTAAIRKKLGRMVGWLGGITVLLALASAAAQLLFLTNAPIWLGDAAAATALAALAWVFTSALQTAIDDRYYFHERI